MSPFHYVIILLSNSYKRKLVWKNVDVRNKNLFCIGVPVLINVKPTSINYPAKC